MGVHSQSNLTRQSSRSTVPCFVCTGREAHFVSTVGLVQQLSQVNGNAVLPEMIVVGITNTNRSRDLAPSLAAGSGYNNFIKFIETELMPHIEIHYNAAPYRVLVGHSLGGLTAIDMLTNKPALFNASIAIDPSMWYDNERILKNVIRQLPNSRLENKRLFIGTANTMPKGITLSALTKDRSYGTQHIRSIFKLDSFLKTKPNSGLMYAQKFYENESHISVPLISAYDGLRFIFDYYLIDVSEKDFIDPTPLIAQKYQSHYARVSREMGYPLAPPESFISYLGYDALGKKQYNKAAALFTLNIENYPASSKVYDAYADYWAALKDTLNAIAYYKKALSKKEEVTTLNKLRAISRQQAWSVPAKELEIYAGAYMIEAYKAPVTLTVKDGVLYAATPGQNESQLIPVSNNVFTVANKQGYTITFRLDGKKVIGFTSVQPNGTFEAKKE